MQPSQAILTRLANTVHTTAYKSNPPSNSVYIKNVKTKLSLSHIDRYRVLSWQYCCHPARVCSVYTTNIKTKLDCAHIDVSQILLCQCYCHPVQYISGLYKELNPSHLHRYRAVFSISIRIRDACSNTCYALVSQWFRQRKL